MKHRAGAALLAAALLAPLHTPAPLAATDTVASAILPAAPVRWAVIIGIGEYADPRVAPVEYADEDAWALASFLTSPAAGTGAVAPENLTLLLNEEATGRNIRSALITFLRRAGPEDVITVFIAGQSATDPERPGDAYLLPYDVEADKLVESALPVMHVFHALDQAYAYQKILLTDVSHFQWVRSEDRRGMLPNPVNQQFLNGEAFVHSRYVAMTASEPGRPSIEGQRWGGGHGVFAHYLLEGLKGAADEDGDRFVRLDELITFTRDRVRMATGGEQVPVASSSAYDPTWILAGRR